MKINLEDLISEERKLEGAERYQLDEVIELIAKEIIQIKEAVKQTVDGSKNLALTIVDIVKFHDSIWKDQNEWNKKSLQTIKDVAKQVTTLKLLIEHEEKIRVTKAQKTRVETVIPKFKIGDRVVIIPKIGYGSAAKATIQMISRDGKRIKVSSKAPHVDTEWFPVSRIELSTVKG